MPFNNHGTKPDAWERAALIAERDALGVTLLDTNQFPLVQATGERIATNIRAAARVSTSTPGPEIVCICGSTRFRAEMTDANRRLTLAGAIVVAPGVFGHDGDEMTDDQKIALDSLHLQKIDLARRIYVVNPGGYIGESTRREIAYAESTGKIIDYLVDPTGPDPTNTAEQPTASGRVNATDDLLISLGFVPSYYLCRHPAWPDPLHIWPSTAEHAEKTYNDHPHPDAYVMRIWEKGPREIVHPARGPHEDETAETEAGVAP